MLAALDPAKDARQEALRLDVQIRQTAFRQTLADHWQVNTGARLIEVGCGQGDMTAVLADHVGPLGSVLAVDLASPDYGAPVSLGASAEHLRAGPLGRSIEFLFEFDLLDPPVGWNPPPFDVAVLALCTWYFRDLEQLKSVLLALAKFAPRLCFAEWDMVPISSDQFGHWLAVLVQGQVGAFNLESEANVRTPYARQVLMHLLAETGWQIEREAALDTSGLDDARWEVEACLGSSLNGLFLSSLPIKQRDLVESQLQILKQLAMKDLRPLPIYSVVATRA
jgi:hypothetical protein